MSVCNYQLKYFTSFHLDGTSILGSSNMCTRYWAGILSVFNSPDDLADQSKCRASMEFEGGLSCAKFVSGSKVIFDSTIIYIRSMLDLERQPHKFCNDIYI